MTRLNTYSLETLSLTSTKGAGAKPITLTGSASLMTNYEPARAVDAGHRIETLEDINGNPMIFSSGTEGALFAILRSEKIKTGWIQIDLTSVLKIGPVECFGTQQLGDGSCALAVSLKGANGPRVFLATPPADPSEPAWAAPEKIWREVPSREVLKAVSTLTVGTNPDRTKPIVIATASHDGINHDRFVVAGGNSPWQSAPIPQNAHRDDGKDPILAMVIGTYPKLGLAGTYTLYYAGETLQLGFDTLNTPENTAKIGSKPLHFPLDAPPNTRAIAAVDAREGGTDLFALADGIYHYSLETQCHEAAPNRIAALPEGADGEIAALADDDTIAIWSLRGGILSYMSGDVSEAPNWNTLLPLRRDVGQIAALRNKTLKTNQLFDVDASNNLSYFYQDPRSTIWAETPINLPDTGKAEKVPGYTTVLSFKDPNGVPWQGEVDLAATGWIYVTINGQSHVLSPGKGSTVSMRTDALGRVTLIARAHTANTPMITLSSKAFTDVVDINPAAVISANLAPFTDPNKLASAKTQTGASVIGPNAKISASDTASAFGALKATMDACSPNVLNLRTPGQPNAHQIDPARLAQALSAEFAITIDNTGSSAPGFADKSATFESSNSALGDLKASFGDIFDTLTQGLVDVVKWSLQTVKVGAGHVLKFIVHLAKGVKEVIVDTIEKALQVLSWVLDQIEVGFEKLIEWLGELLGWGDILTTQKVVVNSFNKLLDWTTDKAQDLKQTVDDGLTAAYDAIEGFRPKDAPTKTPLALAESERAKDGSLATPDSPAASFSAYHLQHSGALDHFPNISVTLEKTIADFIDTVEGEVKSVAEGWKQVFKDLLAGLEDHRLSIGDLLKTVISDQLTGTIKNAKILFDGMLDVFGDLARLLKAILNHMIDLPIFSALFRAMTGGKSSMLNVFAFMCSISATQALRAMQAGDIKKEAAPLANENLSADEFFNLIHDTLDKQGKITSKTALIYNRIAGAVSIELTAMADLMTTLSIATANFLSKVFTPLRFVFVVLRLPLKLPAITDHAMPVRMVSYLASIANAVFSFIAGKVFGDIGSAIVSGTLGLLSAGVGYLTTAAIGIMAAVNIEPGAANYLLIWATTSTNLSNAVENGIQTVLGAIISATSASAPEVAALFVALAAVFTVWFAIRPVLNTARLALVTATGSDRPYWLG